ncbi:MAG: acyltransferase [Parabacteroides gordonii]
MQRNLYFDALRGIAIMMVVAIHTFYACEFESWLSICAISMREIFNMAVPMFLAISGFFIGRMVFEDKRQVFVFWKKQIPKVYIPVLFWSIPYFALAILEGQSILENVLLLFFCGYSIYYFIALIVQCYLLLPVIQKKMLNPVIGGGVLCISMICVTVVSYTSITKLPLIVFAGPVIVWLIFFWLGVYISRSSRDYNIRWILIGVIISFVLMVIETKFRHEATGGGYGIKPSSFVFSFLMILLLFSKRIEMQYKSGNIVNKVLIVMGNYSFPIYLIHCFVIILVFYFVSIPVWIIRWAIVVVITMLIIYLARKVLPKKYLKIIGF